MWIDACTAVTTKAGRYVQAAAAPRSASLLEVEIVTADGKIRIANAYTNPDLFWAVKGGGGGTFGIVTRMTLRTHALPAYFGGVFGEITAANEGAYRALNWMRTNEDYSFMAKDGREGAPSHHAVWAGDREQAGWTIHGYASTWLPARLLDGGALARLADSLYAANYARLLKIKQRYDPDGLFTVRDGVGSEDRSADGFTRKG